MTALADLSQGLLTLLPWLGIAAAAAVAAFYSGSETGAYRVNRVRLRLARQRGRPGADRLARLLADMPGLICVTLVGTNVAVYAATVLMTRQFHGGGRSALAAEMLATLVLAPLLFVFAEVLPKNVYNAEADRLMYGSSALLAWSRRVFAAVGLVGLLKGISRLWRWIDRLRRGESAAQEANPFPAQARLRAIVRDSAAEGIVTPYQNELVEKILGLRDVHVGDAMVPAQRVIYLHEGASAQEFLRTVRAHEFSRLPVMSAAGGEAVGIVPVHEVLEAMSRSAGAQPMDFVRPAVLLSPGMSVTQAIFALQRNRTPMAIVRGSAGQFQGIVTLKDLVEEIVGELEAW